MKFKIIISDEAKFDLKEHYLFYKKVANKNIADNFFFEFNRIKNIISKNPNFQIWYKDYRCVPLKKYPFLVFFFIDIESKHIIIARIFHTSQNPEKYPK